MTEMIDVHCHVLPGIDDGAADQDVALALLRKEYADGVRRVIATPHYRRRMFEPTMGKIIAAYHVLREKAAEVGIDLYLGCEYHVNMEITEDIFAGNRPTLAGSRYVLSEFSSASSENFIRERCCHMRSRGLVPVIAHVERYPALTKDLDLIEELSEMGCMIQVNAGSFLGEDGFKVKRFCKKLLSYGMVDLVGSDCHDLKQRLPRMGECAAWLEKKAGSAYTEKLLRGNAEKILENK